MKHTLPTLPHLQAAILQQLQHEAVLGEELRTGLKHIGSLRTKPGFYQLMARMERQKLVIGCYYQYIKNNQIIRQRAYTATAKGSRMLLDTQAFYGAMQP